MKATEQYCPVVLLIIIMLYKVVLPLESVVEILKQGFPYVPDTSVGDQQSCFGVQLFLSQSIQGQQGRVFYDLPSAGDTFETKPINPTMIFQSGAQA